MWVTHELGCSISTLPVNFKDYLNKRPEQGSVAFYLKKLILFITVHKFLQTYQVLEALPAFHVSFVISVHLENDCLASCSHKTQAVSQKSVSKRLLQSSYSLSCLRELLFIFSKTVHLDVAVAKCATEVTWRSDETSR